MVRKMTINHCLPSGNLSFESFFGVNFSAFIRIYLNSAIALSRNAPLLKDFWLVYFSKSKTTLH